MSEGNSKPEITEDQLQEAAKILGIDFPSLYEALLSQQVKFGENAKVKYAEHICVVVRHQDGTKDTYESGDNIDAKKS